MKVKDYILTTQRILKSLPPSLRKRLRNLEIVVEDWPEPEDLKEAGLEPGGEMYGIFVGRSELERGFADESPVPERIVLYKGPLEEDFGSLKELKKEIRKTLLHEIGHFFGLSDEEIEKLGYG